MYTLIVLFFSAIYLEPILSNDHEFNEKGFEIFLNQIKGNGKKISGIYGQFDKCQGYFHRIQMDVIDQKYDWKCNHVWTHVVNVTANGYCNNSRHILDTISEQVIKDVNGDEDYNSKGLILKGGCSGAQLVVQSYLNINKGRCQTGVTELYSKSYSALIALKGVCETTCNGTVWSHYWPAKFLK